jgi:beta-phosphoglucomutase-like phosphatase (HAD superfamily)
VAAVRALAFDFNGTLSDDERLLCGIYEELFAAHGTPISSTEYFERLAGLPEETILGGWLGVEGEALATLVEERIARYRALAADGSTIPERVRAAVRYAAERVPVALVSGAFRTEVESVLAGAGLLESFHVLVTADDVDAGKPAPEGYAKAIHHLGVAPDEAVAFEDTEAGVAAAKGAGLLCVAVPGTQAPARLAMADAIADQLDTALVRRLLA